MSNLNLKYLDRRLLNSEVGHLDVKTMEVNAIKTFVDRRCKPTLTNFLDSSLVRDGTVLVELSEQVVELDKGSRVLGVHGPEGGAR